MPKARVLPDPVGAFPHTSRPARASGSVMVWIGNGDVMPLASSADTMSDGTPSTAKEEAEGGMEALSGYRGSTGVCLGNRQAHSNGAAGETILSDPGRVPVAAH